MPTVRILIRLKPSLLDSAGRAVHNSLEQLGFSEVQDVRIGKLIELNLSDFDEYHVEQMCEKLLTNPVIENYEIEVGD